MFDECHVEEPCMGSLFLSSPKVHWIAHGFGFWQHAAVGSGGQSFYLVGLTTLIHHPNAALLRRYISP